MSDARIDKLADLIVNYSVALKPGDKVLIQGSALAAPLLNEVYAAALRAGGHPFIIVGLAGTNELFFKYASDGQLQFIHEPMKLALQTYDVQIGIGGDENTRTLSGVDPAKMVQYSRAQTELRKIFMQRSASGALRWVYGLFPTNAYAQDAEMSLSDYEDFVFHACMPDISDPVGYWRRFSARQQEIVEWLKGKKEVHLKGLETELRLQIDGRTFINCDGKKNMPDGEVFTGPVENSVEGQVYFSYPAICQGREVTGVRLWFEGGKVIKASAEKNEDFLLKTLDTDEGARYVGEFAIGTNEGVTRFTRQILFDEKIGGSFHLALGAGFPETGSQNQSSLHWDMICDLRQGGEIWVDGELMYKDGKFVI